jgi:hypothetical protein
MMSRDSQDAPRPAPRFDPASVVTREYERAAVAALALWLMVGTLLMFSGTALLDTSGLGVVVVESGLLLAIDRPGFYTAAGLFKVDQWSPARRVLLAIAEVPGFYFVLVIYVIRIGMAQYSQLEAAGARTRRP